MDANAFFAAAVAVARQIHEERQAEREELRRLRAERLERLRVARNARRRAAYAARGPAPKRRTPAEIEADMEAAFAEQGCQCMTARMPPCSWCESGGDGEEL